MESRGFIKSNYDDFLFTNRDMIVLFWVDNCIFYTKDTKTIDKVILSLKDGFILEQKKAMLFFLGIHSERDKDNNKLTLTQTGLIEKSLGHDYGFI